MQLGLTEATSAPVERGKAKALVVSLGIHVATFAGLMYTPPIQLSDMMQKSPSE